MKQSATMNPALLAGIRALAEGDRRDASIMRTLSHYSASRLARRSDYQRSAGYLAGGLSFDTGEVLS